MDDLQKLLDIEAIRNLKARYFRYLDIKDWASFKEVWAPEIEHDMVSEGQTFRGASSDFVDGVEKALSDIVTVHHGQTSEIEITSSTTAKGLWAFVDLVRPNPGASTGAREMIGYGHYHETYLKSQNAGWQIKTQVITRLRVDHPDSGS